MLAYNEETGETGYYTVTAVMVHTDPTIVHLIIDGETIETTPEHPFYVMDSAPWLATGETAGRWVNAGELHIGDAVRQADGTTGIVQAVVVVERSQPVYHYRENCLSGLRWKTVVSKYWEMQELSASEIRFNIISEF